MHNVCEIGKDLAASGPEQDADLYYYRARYYDPSTGRFLSEDPLGNYGGQNFFAYVGNKPIGHIDPSGLTDMNYDVVRRNDGSWGLGEGQFHVDLPPKITYDCVCVGNGKFQLKLTVTWYIRIFYGSKSQLKHENGHLAILQDQFDSRKLYYQNTYEQVYPSKEACDKASWDIRDQVNIDLQKDYVTQGKLQAAHDDWFEQIFQWWPWHH